MTGWQYFDASALVCGTIAVGGLLFGGSPLTVLAIVVLVACVAAWAWATA